MATVSEKLRGKFARQDRLRREAAELEAEIKVLIRALSTEQGLVTPMRPEQARADVFFLSDQQADAA